MSDEPDPTPPLPYRNAADDRRPFDVAACLFGGISGAVPVGLVGLVLIPIHVSRATSRPVDHLPPSFGFAAAAAVALLGAWATFRRSRGRRARLLGWLIGVGVACLIEGACFAAQG